MRRLLNIVICLSLFSSSANALERKIKLPPEEIQWIGERVFQNECSGIDDCLMEWNAGEDFLSLGIGHFIWYPNGQIGPFEESFPKLIRYLKAKKLKVPDWLNGEPFPQCPWHSREDFLRHRQSREALELLEFLKSSKLEQSQFLIQNMNDALPRMLRMTSWWKQDDIRKQFYRMAETPLGVFVLVDYANFKGLGVKLSERYHQKGWGLLQVLTVMKGKESDIRAVEEFIQSAKKILTERVKNSPPERNEKKWLSGWHSRMESYLITPRKNNN